MFLLDAVRPRQGTPDRGGVTRQDVLLGFGLSAALFFVLTCTAWVLRSEQDGFGKSIGIAAAGTLIAYLLTTLPWERLPVKLLLVFPAVLFAVLIAIAGLTHGISPGYSGFLTLAFIYLGLTQGRAVPAVASLIAIPTFIYCQERLAASVGVRCVIATGIWLIIGDVLATRSAQNRTRTALLLAQANTDSLTGLASRRRLSECIDHALGVLAREEASYFLLLLDLDGFKNINDTYGHAVGDDVLVAVARRVEACVRSEDVVARLGGDEFALLLRGGDLSSALALGARLLAAVAGPMPALTLQLALTASGGIVQLDRHMSSSDALRGADVSMYEAKSSGKARLAVFEQHMQERIAERHRLDADLRRGLERDEFEVYYQPTVHAGTGEVVGVEALVRWHHPERGPLLPGDFIDAAEENGLIFDLGRWILEQACLQAQRWQPVDPGRQLAVAVNLSPRQLLETDLAHDVRAALVASGLPGSALILEITEGLLMGDAPLAVERLVELRALGARIAIDDFGTGYSSLAYLRDFPIDIVKIDQRFVAALGAGHQASALLRAIMSIAEALDLDVIAEGVETRAQLEALSEMGCKVMQGHYFAAAAQARVIGRYLSDASRPVSVRP